jgi:hypothetical protein
MKQLIDLHGRCAPGDRRWTNTRLVDWNVLGAMMGVSAAEAKRFAENQNIQKRIVEPRSIGCDGGDASVFEFNLSELFRKAPDLATRQHRRFGRHRDVHDVVHRASLVLDQQRENRLVIRTERRPRIKTYLWHRYDC